MIVIVHSKIHPKAVHLHVYPPDTLIRDGDAPIIMAVLGDVKYYQHISCQLSTQPFLYPQPSNMVHS